MHRIVGLQSRGRCRNACAGIDGSGHGARSGPSLTLHHFGRIGYWLYSPENSRPGLKPVVYLHGGSGKGSDASLVLQNGFPKLLKEGLLGRPNCYILIPQLSGEYRDWAEMQGDLFALLDDVTARFDIDGICLTGHSMGGTATWTLALAAPERFCCIVPLSGSIHVPHCRSSLFVLLSVQKIRSSPRGRALHLFEHFRKSIRMRKSRSFPVQIILPFRMHIRMKNMTFWVGCCLNHENPAAPSSGGIFICTVCAYGKRLLSSSKATAKARSIDGHIGQSSGSLPPSSNPASSRSSAGFLTKTGPVRCVA